MTFGTGTSFVLSGKVCRVWRNTRTRVHYVTEHTSDRDNDTMHVTDRSTLEGFASAGLVTPWVRSPAPIAASPGAADENGQCVVCGYTLDADGEGHSDDCRLGH